MPEWDRREFLVEGTTRAFETLVEADEWVGFAKTSSSSYGSRLPPIMRVR